MKTYTNLDSQKVEKVYLMTGFNYESATAENNDGTLDIYFDSQIDSQKFIMLYNELK
jgi:hypothetical protein